MNMFAKLSCSISGKPFLLLTHVIRECRSEERPKRGPGFFRKSQHDHRETKTTPRTSKVPKNGGQIKTINSNLLLNNTIIHTSRLVSIKRALLRILKHF